jgi:hypothetical protein
MKWNLAFLLVTGPALGVFASAVIPDNGIAACYLGNRFARCPVEVAAGGDAAKVCLFLAPLSLKHEVVLAILNYCI